VTLPDGTKVGEIQKLFGKSLLRSTYVVYGPDGEEVARTHERSVPVAIFRRVIGWIPFIGEVADWLPIPYDFEFFRGDQKIGTHRRRRWQWRDVYDLDFTTDSERALDRRMVLAIAVGMDALQAR
jgi:hypothetical protein